MGLIARIIEGFPFFCFISAVSQMNGNTALKHVSEFLPFMRSVRIRGAAGGEDKVNRFHNIFLGIWDNPLYFIFQFCVFLGEIVVFAEDDRAFRYPGD